MANVKVKPIVGRRKTSVARVTMVPGTGKITVNGKDVKVYFPVERLSRVVTAALRVTDSEGKFDIKANVFGGGISGQAGAISLGISRALDKDNSARHEDLKRSGLLTRDPRMVERKKYGLHKARKGTQFSKR